MKMRIAGLGGKARRHAALAVLAVAALGAVALLLAGGGEGNPPPTSNAPDEGHGAIGTESGGLLGVLRDDPLAAVLGASFTVARSQAVAAALKTKPKRQLSRFTIASIREGERVELRDGPDGALIEKLGDRTEFGSRRSFWVARAKGEWLGVPVAELPNGELGWIHLDITRLELFETRYSVVADVSERRLELRYGRKVLEDVPVTVGAPGSPTPTGAYAVTDGLAGEGLGPYYGCCVLALSGHQPNLPPDWLGGDRIAIHGTPGALGLAASLGCLRASNLDMVGLFARVPLGAPVFIRP